MTAAPAPAFQPVVTAAILVIGFFHAGALGVDDLRSAMIVLVGAEVTIVVLAALNMSATAVSREREDGTLDLILTTPIQPGPYIAGKLRGLVTYLLPMLLVPVVTMILLAIFLFLIGIQSILMGILADLQMRTFYESQGKRTYIVRQALGFRDK